jgi:predicted RNA-binding Zn-ribbon protein involved in translation (DUF1610 family)
MLEIIMSEEFRDSPKSQYQRTRSNININLWSSHGTTNEQSNNQWCNICKVRLIPKENGTVLFCKECGQYTNITDYSKEKKLVPRYPNAPGKSIGTTVISKDAKNKKKPKGDYTNSDLSEEDRRELQGMGLNV